MICPPAAVTIFTKPVTYLLKLTPCTKSFILFIKFLHIFINVNGALFFSSVSCFRIPGTGKEERNV